jgi:hypothetical protein
MRTLKFTHEQIEQLKEALKIAEISMFEQADRFAKMGLEGIQKMTFEKSNEIYDLRAGINNGEFDD